MKKLSVHLIIFCTFFLHLPNTQAADVEFFDFDDYEARMASMDERDQDAEKQINRLLAPLDVPLGGNRGNLYNALGDNDALMQEVLAESIKTAKIEQERRVEQAQEAFHEVREKAIQINHKIGELTGIKENIEKNHQIAARNLEEKQKNSDDALELYLKLSKNDPEIEALENGEEKIKRLKEHEIKYDKARDEWIEAFNLHKAAKEELATTEDLFIVAKAKLAEAEEEEKALEDQFSTLSLELDILKKPGNL